MIKKLLIANRGEIACRIIHTVQQLGITAVAVYSTIDEQALHVSLADEAYGLGAALSSDSYLRQDKLLAIAKQAQVDAIHPGYGFLSENAVFAQAVMAAGILWIGPPPDAIHAMGEKQSAKTLMEKAGVPVLKGTQGDADTLMKMAKTIGYPVLLKATAGGGGKGMRIVNAPDEFLAAFKQAESEALASFGDGSLLVENYLTKTRHIEVQVLADQQGNAMHLFERDCSLQRRQQKIIEEAPAPCFSQVWRDAMGQAAVDAARAIHYVGVGTVEFLFDLNAGDMIEQPFYFMEMNTRLQVEHPVTELITGLDLVEWQLRVALGSPLPMTVKRKGHAIEARICAEDPNNHFLPATGKIHYLREPESARVDSGIKEKDRISPYYDPLLAKLIVWGDTRKAAIDAMANALTDYHIVGVTTNIPYLHQLIQSDLFQAGDLHTQFIDQHPPIAPELPIPIILAAAHYQIHQQTNDQTSPWKKEAWQLNLPAIQTFLFQWKKEKIQVQVNHQTKLYHINKKSYHCVGLTERSKQRIRIDGVNVQCEIYPIGHSLVIYEGAHSYELTVCHYHDLTDLPVCEEGSLAAPMPGMIADLHVGLGDTVNAGDPLIVLEAMKMQHTLYAPQAGQIAALPFSIGELVEEGVELVSFE